MENISFSNFRRFKTFPELKLGGITYLVGTNNSGKSSFAKAVMLCLRNLRSTGRGIIGMRHATFYYDVSGANVGSFERALCKNATPIDSNWADSYQMQFNFEVSGLKFSISIISERKEYMSTTAADINEIEISDLINDINYLIDYSTFSIKVRKGERGKLLSFKLLDTVKDPNIPTIVRILDSIKKEYFYQYRIIPKKSSKHPDSLEFIYFDEKTGSFKYDDYDSEDDKDDVSVNSSRCNANIVEADKARIIKYLVGHEEVFKKSLSHIKEVVLADHYIFIPSHLASQKVMLVPDNKNDYIAQVAKEFKRMNLHSNNKFIKTWMDREHFCIGKSFNVISERGEAYRIEITNFLGERMDLAEAGRGSVQLMVLLLKFASIISKYGEDKSFEKPLIIIEEPEQNLHPKMQSKISDLFLYMNEKFGFRFIVETHSEYIIRRTQVSVAEKHYEDEAAMEKNPITVYYFDETNPEVPFYQMKYRTNGVFSNDFGAGFYDEASNLLFEIL